MAMQTSWAMIGHTEFILILLVLLLLFGARRVPDLARSLGRSLSEFKKGREEGDREPKVPASDTRKNGEQEQGDDQKQSTDSKS